MPLLVEISWSGPVACCATVLPGLVSYPYHRQLGARLRQTLSILLHAYCRQLQIVTLRPDFSLAKLLL